jgi:hypothetical protein
MAPHNARGVRETPGTPLMTNLDDQSANPGSMRELCKKRPSAYGVFASGASRDRTGDLLLAKSTVGVIIDGRTLPKPANWASVTDMAARTLPLFAVSA